jgi:colanic acid/amylovoran biosynthesis glycosyltransferase
MRVAILTGDFPKFSEAWLLDQAAAALDAGIEVVVVGERPPTPTPHGEEAHRLGLLDRATHMGPMGPGRIRRVIRAGVGASGDALRRGPGRLRALDWRAWGGPALSGQIGRAARVFERIGEVDLVHAHHGGNAVIAAALKRMGVVRAPVLATFHGSDALARSVVHRHRGYRAVWPLLDRITTNTEFLRTVVVGLGGPGERIDVLPMGIRASDFEFRPPPSSEAPIRCATVGRLIRWKGIDTLVEAIGLLERGGGGPQIELHLVGDGEERVNLESLAKERGVGDRVVFHGWRPRGEVIRILSQSHLFAQPSRRLESGETEAQGVAPLEAQAIGVPTLVSDSGGLPETVDSGRSGEIVPADDPEAWAEALSRIGGDPASWEEMGRAGRAWVEGRFDAATLGDRLVSIYERTARG